MNPQSPGPAARRHETNTRSRRARAAAVLPVLAAAFLAAACGGSPSSAGSGGAPSAAGAPSLAGFARCMRAHGVLNFPGPDSTGQIPGGKSTLIRLARSSSHYRVAARTCQRLWPYQAPTQAQQQQQLASDLKFARCMRAHGLPNFPDPANGPKGPVFVLSTRDGFNPHSPQVLAKAHQCQRVLPPGSPLPSATEAP